MKHSSIKALLFVAFLLGWCIAHFANRDSDSTPDMSVEPSLEGTLFELWTKYLLNSLFVLRWPRSLWCLTF